MNPTVRHCLVKPEYQLALLEMLDERVATGAACIRPNQVSWGPVSLCGQGGRVLVIVEDAVGEVDSALEAEAASLLRRTWALSHRS